jgi:hypothetical protein
MADQSLRYEQLLTELGPVLSEQGFRRRGQRFHLRGGDNWALVEFQKSTKSTREATIFTVNLGVALGRLLTFAGVDTARPPSIDQCHWSERIGFLVGSRDKWWTIDQATDVGALDEELRREIVDRGVPEIKRLLSEEALKILWLEGRSPGLTDIQRLKHLSVLLKALGPAEQLEPTLRRLEDLSAGKPTAGMVKHHIDRLNATAVR